MIRTKLLFLCLAVMLFTSAAFAQSSGGTVSGIVLDPSGSAIPEARIDILNDATHVLWSGKSNGEGIYVAPNLAPGSYRIQVSRIGFKTMIKPDVVLNTQDALAINFTLSIGAASETVTVAGGAPLIDTASGSVSTVIDRQFVESLPLNGRSFNSLLQLTPGVVIAQSTSSNQGQFSVDGQRTSSNNFLVDGVSANFGVAPTSLLGTTGTGTGQAFSALGGTSSLVSVEALQEFRVETSSFAPEFGRSAGGQVQLTTRSGTNDVHGGLYEYFRNDVLDANDWFAKQADQPRAPERHNDFGAFTGGPLWKNHSFFFASYEGVRLRQPSTMIVQVPSAYARSVATPNLLPFLAAYPQPDATSTMPGVYTAPFTGSYSNPSTLNAGSIRFDHTFDERLSVFFRYNDAPSQAGVRTNSLSEFDTTAVNTRTITLGATFTPTRSISDTFRGNYSAQDASYTLALDNFGGAQPPTKSLLAPGLAAGDNLLQFLTEDTSYYAMGPSSRNSNAQINFADDLSITRGTHQLKFGVDFRRDRLQLNPYQNSVEYIADTVADFLNTGQVLLYTSASRPSTFLTDATSLYGQDAWKISPRVTLTYGMRWELNPAPSGGGKTQLAAWTSVSDLADFGIAPAGTPIWRTTYGNFAPRLGLAYNVTGNGNLVVRGGWGIFYDLASDAVGNLGSSFPNYSSNCCDTVQLPVASVSPYLTPLPTLAPPFPEGATGYDGNLSLPRSYQWNVAVERALPGKQTISATYVGQSGTRLLRQTGISQPNKNFQGYILLTENGARSNYNALQLQYKRPLANHLQALVNYSWAHSLDNASSDIVTAVSTSLISTANDYGSSDFDVRNSFSGAVTFEPPGLRGESLLAFLTKAWSLDASAVARSGFPFNGSVLTSTIAGAYPRPDRVPGEPVWIADSTAGGGKRLNPAAFLVPTAGEQGNESRNDLSGFGLTQLDLSVGRTFPLGDRFHLLFRTDAFNLFNHPNFTSPQAFVGLGPTYLQSPSMANHGLGGLNPLFQEGGPRSLQLSLRLTF